MSEAVLLRPKCLKLHPPGTVVRAEHTKFIIHIKRKFHLNFVIFSKFLLDKSVKGCYINLARVGGICGFFKARTAMMQEIARQTR